MLLPGVGILGALMVVPQAALTQEVPATVILAQKGPDRGGARWLQQLNLSPEQMQKIQDIRARYKSQIEQNSQTLRLAQQELSNLMAGVASTNEIREKHRQVQQLRQQLAQIRFESMLEIREVLNPAQRRQFIQMMQQRRRNSLHRLNPL
ncbi:MAG: Spy/CpxP family protein refolding chaperone [Oscillatoriaceae bacterium SKW80]|nr:Spy/CpxP family protein refolding chaperone [Oscillatoriaceae bacterium SKYG93]MCX8121753.1 Spy/CpxP family protein refolding chaperone [Oscillatoriaceae bacterium SKW80]MDW8453630.1 Spy/CpxP family protein refolding chaperone [Oscillatoriaceae cyanobacterium SKYGB_i_bin93]HIK28696.1 Spy/CpxP family protein refolding chaperone [Oscillatoriaceae cyanobacterium M7585_C2015_266]